MSSLLAQVTLTANYKHVQNPRAAGSVSPSSQQNSTAANHNAARIIHVGRAASALGTRSLAAGDLRVLYLPSDARSRLTKAKLCSSQNLRTVQRVFLVRSCRAFTLSDCCEGESIRVQERLAWVERTKRPGQVRRERGRGVRAKWCVKLGNTQNHSKPERA
eukprot:3870804-Pleurochrysis_carterae.AAC.1